MRRLQRGVTASLGGVLVLLLALPIVALVFSATAEGLQRGASHPMFVPALALSLRTTVVSLALTLVMGTPLAWWLSRGETRTARVVEWVVNLPILIPPAVIGVALLVTFGRSGAVGELLARLDITVPFSAAAVVLAQLIVSAPFYVQAAANAFRSVDRDTLIVAESLGASPWSAFARIAIPIARPGLVVGATLAWARALGEFGATLLFAGNMTERTQTMPLAIFSALESDVQLSVVFSLIFVAIGAALFGALRLLWGRS